ncbi:MAG: PAS domain S-box protein [Planctomycetes bacterium]|nr:PAS domain S-box protein [Planctomycetota bacterium]
MAVPKIRPTGVERTFADDEIIVSKTDPQGRITYANRVFLRVSGYTELELLGQPHNILRHPDMPRSVFRLLWHTIANGQEVFAYVVNLAKNGDHYWVLAHVTPTFDDAGKITGYHSSRRRPKRDAVQKAQDLYANLLAVEAKHADKRSAMDASARVLTDLLETAGVAYDEFAFSL